jgi:catechol 2,3-dioxygenase-like lactoylglutathione lyase family enzyme
MLNTAKLKAFVATTDAARARRFYEDILGLRLLSEDDFALTFDSNGTTLRVQKVGQHTPLPFTSLGWEVADITAAVDQLRERGVSFGRYPGMDQDERGIWHAPNGTRVAWFQDPDGNTLAVSQA